MAPEYIAYLARNADKRVALFIKGTNLMRILICLMLALSAAGYLPGCSSGSSAAVAPTPPPAAVNGLDTPKSVAVVTAN